MRITDQEPDAVSCSNLQSAGMRTAGSGNRAKRHAPNGTNSFRAAECEGLGRRKSWISTSTLLFRNNFANYLINGDSMLSEPAARRGSGDLGFRVAAGGALAQEFAALQSTWTKLCPPRRGVTREIVAELEPADFSKGPPPEDAAAFSKFLEARGGTTDDSTIRGLLHLMMSTPHLPTRMKRQ